MPYLRSKKRRKELTPHAQWESCADGAELNFLICTQIDLFIKTHGLSYHTLEEIDGALDLARLEFVRRIVAPYEEIKRVENGEVFHHAAKELDDLWVARSMHRGK